MRFCRLITASFLALALCACTVAESTAALDSIDDLVAEHTMFSPDTVCVEETLHHSGYTVVQRSYGCMWETEFHVFQNGEYVATIPLPYQGGYDPQPVFQQSGNTVWLVLDETLSRGTGIHDREFVWHNLADGGKVDLRVTGRFVDANGVLRGYMPDLIVEQAIAETRDDEEGFSVAISSEEEYCIPLVGGRSVPVGVRTGWHVLDYRPEQGGFVPREENYNPVNHGIGEPQVFAGAYEGTLHLLAQEGDPLLCEWVTEFYKKLDREVPFDLPAV